MNNNREEKSKINIVNQPKQQIYNNKATNNGTVQQSFKYTKKQFLTKNELEFYKDLRKIAIKYNFTILSKIRLADLLEYNDYKDFNRIKAKHIDFALCDSENLNAIYLIELQDNSHKKQSRIERDIFVNSVLKNAGYKIFWVYNSSQLEQAIMQDFMINYNNFNVYRQP